jgi:hypothetical protein
MGKVAELFKSPLQVNIVGNVSVGSTLTASIAKSIPSVSWQWYRSVDGGVSYSAIQGATLNTYTITSADVGNIVSAVASVSSASAIQTIPASTPVSVSAPALNQPAAVGAAINIVPAGFAGGNLTVTTAVYRDGTVIPGAGAGYVPQASDVGHALTVKQTATNSLGSVASSTSNAMVVAAAPYMIACNRLGLATDFATTDTGYLSTDTTGRSGGNGTTQFQYAFTRTKFTTTWTASNGRFLWSNWVNTLYGMLSVPFTLLIQKAQVRDMAGNLIANITWGGNGSVTVAANGAAGSYIWNDPLSAPLPAGTYYCDVWYQPTLHGSYPGLPPMVLTNESGNESTSDLSSSGPFTGTFSQGYGGRFGPQRFIAQGWDGTPVVQVFGDSIVDYNYMSAPLATSRGDCTWPGMAFGDTTTGGGAWNYHIAARYSSMMQAVSTDNAGSTGTTGLAAWLAAVDGLVQSAPMFTHIFCEHGRNNINASQTLDNVKTNFSNLVAKVQSLWPGVNFWQTTTTPYTTSSSYMYWTDQNSQSPYDASQAAGGVLNQWNNYLLAGGISGVKGSVDTAAAVRDPVNYANWANVEFATTVTQAIPAATNNIVWLFDAPPLGASLVFEPGNPTSADPIYASYPYAASSITGMRGAYNVTLNSGRRSVYAPPYTGWASRVVKAHAVGTPVRANITPDGLHPNHYGCMLMRDVVISRKNAMRYS